MAAQPKEDVNSTLSLCPEQWGHSGVFVALNVKNRVKIHSEIILISLTRNDGRNKAPGPTETGNSKYYIVTAIKEYFDIFPDMLIY